MLSMPTSKRRTKLNKILGISLGFCCLISMTGCSKGEDEPADTNPKTEEKETIDINNFQQLMGTKVVTTVPTNVYRNIDGKMQDVGKAEQGIYLDIKEEQLTSAYLPINGTEYFINGKDVQLSDRWFKNETHLLPTSQAIQTNKTYQIEDIDGTLQITMNTSDKYEVYVKPSDEDPRYGILYQNGVYYIPSSDIGEKMVSDAIVGETATSIPVMMYHFFYDESLGETRGDVNFVEVQEFEEQCQTLNDQGFTGLTMREVQYFMEDRAVVPLNSYAITIDDGHESVFKYAYPILQKYDIDATMFLIGGWMDPVLPYEFIEMRENGIELQSHSFLMHQGGCSGMGHGGRLMCVNYDEGVQDTIQSFEYVDNGFVYCYPFGDVNENGKNIIRDAGAKLAFTTEFGKISKGMDMLELPRIRVTGGAGIGQYMSHLQ